MYFSVLDSASVSQQMSRKDMKQDAAGTNRSYDVRIENFDLSFGEKYVTSIILSATTTELSKILDLKYFILGFVRVNDLIFLCELYISTIRAFFF